MNTLSTLRLARAACTAAAGAGLLALATPLDANAACKSIPYTLTEGAFELDRSEEHFAELMCASDPDSSFSSRGLYYWDRFGFKKSEGWDRDGYGFNAYCDPERPLGRTLSAFYLIEYSSEDHAQDWDDLSGPLLQSMYPYVARGYNRLDDLRAGGCAEDGSAARHQSALLKDNYTLIYKQGFEKDLMFRAGTLVHENWHWRTDYDHTCGDWADEYYYHDWMITAADPSCPGGRPCKVKNPNPDNLSTYAAEGRWYLDYYVNAERNTNPLLQLRAYKLFKSRINNKICDSSTIPEHIKQWL